ncbi:hypothetical protein HDV04_001513 [Boothiomyces sp. JEL0838]|nr:hypothetical protein HDV04_001513 [Boothiomyces sp. JEL0838]
MFGGNVLGDYGRRNQEKKKKNSVESIDLKKAEIDSRKKVQYAITFTEEPGFISMIPNPNFSDFELKNGDGDSRTNLNFNVGINNPQKKQSESLAIDVDDEKEGMVNASKPTVVTPPRLTSMDLEIQPPLLSPVANGATKRNQISDELIPPVL